jgi:endogenous inhibitor of DNA gyrase (YacG/DUF329 family)
MTSRACATCGALFEVNPRTPRRRYCTPRCRAEDWRRRHNRSDSPSPPNAVNAANGVPPGDNVPNSVNPVRRPNDVVNDDRRATLARCPHCQTPIAVLTLLVPPAAAHVATPHLSHG